jgi:hypothetical protein
MWLHVKNVSVALILGCGLTLVCYFVQKPGQDPNDTALFKLIQHAAYMLEIPGGLIALILSGGRVHDISFALADSANAAIYSALAYACIVLWQRRSSKDAQQYRLR